MELIAIWCVLSIVVALVLGAVLRESGRGDAPPPSSSGDPTSAAPSTPTVLEIDQELAARTRVVVPPERDDRLDVIEVAEPRHPKGSAAGG